MDTPETLAADMVKAAKLVVTETIAVVSKGALNIKNDARKNVEASAPIHNAHAARTINYDQPRLVGMSIESEVGYDRDIAKAANIAWVLEYGGGKDHSPPHRDIGRATDAEESRFLDAMLHVGEKLL